MPTLLSNEVQDFQPTIEHHLRDIWRSLSKRRTDRGDNIPRSVVSAYNFAKTSLDAGRGLPDHITIFQHLALEHLDYDKNLIRNLRDVLCSRSTLKCNTLPVSTSLNQGLISNSNVKALKSQRLASLHLTHQLPCNPFYV